MRHAATTMLLAACQDAPQNVLYFAALGRISAASYQVLSQSKMIFTAILAVTMLKRKMRRRAHGAGAPDEPRKGLPHARAALRPGPVPAHGLEGARRGRRSCVLQWLSCPPSWRFPGVGGEVSRLDCSSG